MQTLYVACIKLHDCITDTIAIFVKHIPRGNNQEKELQPEYKYKLVCVLATPAT